MRNFSDDENSIQLLKSGNIKGFDFLYRKYRAHLFANIYRLVKDVDLSSDILQDVFMTIWQNREKIDLERSFQSLLYSIAKNKVYDFFRKASRDLKLQDQLITSYREHEYNPLEQDLHLKEDIKNLKEEIENLPEKCKEVFKLCKIEGRSYEEVSKLLNISSATVNNHIVKATKILKQRFANFHIILFFLFFFDGEIVDFIL
jgi:RNA polymerase sigma-70 factor (family 1)